MKQDYFLFVLAVNCLKKTKATKENTHHICYDYILKKQTLLETNPKFLTVLV